MTSKKTPGFSERNHLRLVQVQPKSFAGISEDQQLVVVLPDAENVMIAHGDQGTCKTSLLECIKYGLTGEKPVNSTNSKDKNEDVNFVFQDKDGNQIQIRATKSSYNIFKVENPGTTKESRSKIMSPKEWLRTNIGDIGLDPAGLRSMKPADQVNWIRGLVTMSEDELSLEESINKKIKDGTKNRRDVNGVRNSRKKILLASEYYKLKDKHGTTLLETEKYISDKEKYSMDANERHTNAMNALEFVNIIKTEKAVKQQELERQQTRLETINKEIADLEEKLRLAKEMQKTTTDAISSIEVQLADARYENLDNKYEEARKGVDDINDYITQQAEFRSIQKEKAIYDEAVTTYDQLDDILKDLQNKRELFIQGLTPEIEGLEVCISSEVDVKDELSQYKENNPDATEEQIAAEKERLEKMNREGIYINGKSVYEVSESELLAFCIKLWKYSGVRMLVIENLSSYGTDAINTINEFAKAGAQVFASLMERGKDKMEISFYPQIPEKI